MTSNYYLAHKLDNFEAVYAQDPDKILPAEMSVTVVRVVQDLQECSIAFLTSAYNKLHGKDIKHVTSKYEGARLVFEKLKDAAIHIEPQPIKEAPQHKTVSAFMQPTKKAQEHKVSKRPKRKGHISILTDIVLGLEEYKTKDEIAAMLHERIPSHPYEKCFSLTSQWLGGHFKAKGFIVDRVKHAGSSKISYKISERK